MKTSPWHSTSPSDSPVYHDETRCEEGRRIETQNLALGTGERPKCPRCREISN